MALPGTGSACRLRLCRNVVSARHTDFMFRPLRPMVAGAADHWRQTEHSSSDLLRISGQCLAIGRSGEGEPAYHAPVESVSEIMTTSTSKGRILPCAMTALLLRSRVTRHARIPALTVFERATLTDAYCTSVVNHTFGSFRRPAPSSNGRTSVFGSENGGSNPPGAIELMTGRN